MDDRLDVVIVGSRLFQRTAQKCANLLALMHYQRGDRKIRRSEYREVQESKKPRQSADFSADH